MKTTRADVAFEEMLTLLERDLLEATDEDILAAAKELGMDPAMKGSAAFFGVTLLVRTHGAKLSRSLLTGSRRVSARPRPPGDAPTST
jgi:hypothetical protein